MATNASIFETGQGDASCPNCGAPLRFASPALPVKTCGYCQSVIVRSAAGLEKIGEAAMLPFDVSPVQIGTTGRFGDQGFRIVGRIRWGWAHGSWNEWLALFDDGHDQWLGEAMGDFMLTSEVPITDQTDGLVRDFAAGASVPLGAALVEGGVHYVAADVKQARALACEGDLPYKAAGDWVIDSIDFRSMSGKIASLQRDADGTGLYIGQVVSLADLSATNLRTIDGWTTPDYSAGRRA
jgi:hypothetical protein